jgi:hypothetical protein
MTAPRAGRLHIGDFIRCGGMLHEVVGLDGAVAILRSDAGRRVVMKIGALLTDPTFEIVDSCRRRRPLAPAYFLSLPVEVRDRALWLESHVSEVLDGIRAGSPDTAPRPEYDVTRTTLRQRELTKVEELAAMDRSIGLRVLQRYRRDYAIKGIEALIDKRVVRGDLLLAQSLRGLVGLPPVVAVSAAASAGGDSGASPAARSSASQRACQAPVPNVANASEALRNSVRDEPRRRVRPRN